MLFELPETHLAVEVGAQMEKKEYSVLFKQAGNTEGAFG